jgi:hypothetical protein
MHIKPGHPALEKAITIHPTARRSPLETTILKSVAANSKMGKGSNVITKGRWRGMPMFCMSLEERKTCYTGCQQWATCFANNSAFAHRIDHTHPQFLEKLDLEIAEKALVYRHGFVIRPHIVGDFYSPEYAQFWLDQVTKHKNLRIFGFTHWPRASLIGLVIQEGNKDDRVWIRFSDQGGEMSANVEGEGITCPEQTGATASCLTCGLCWTSQKAVNFKLH